MRAHVIYDVTSLTIIIIHEEENYCMYVDFVLVLVVSFQRDRHTMVQISFMLLLADST